MWRTQIIQHGDGDALHFEWQRRSRSNGGIARAGDSVNIQGHDLARRKPESLWGWLPDVAHVDNHAAGLRQGDSSEENDDPEDFGVHGSPSLES